MARLTKMTTAVAFISLLLSSLAMASTQKNEAINLDSLSSALLTLQEQSDKLTDADGLAVSAPQVVSGEVTTLVYTPEGVDGFQYVYSVNLTERSVGAAVYADGILMTRRSISLDTSLSGEQNLEKMRDAFAAMLAQTEPSLREGETAPAGDLAVIKRMTTAIVYLFLLAMSQANPHCLAS